MKLIILLALIGLLSSCGTLSDKPKKQRYRPTRYNLSRIVDICIHNYVDKNVESEKAYGICDKIYRSAR